MKRSITTAAALLMIVLVYAQQPAEIIKLSNPSFEDVPEYSKSVIDGWSDCGTTYFPGESPPDIHRSGGSEILNNVNNDSAYIHSTTGIGDRFARAGWMVRSKSKDGNTYLGMVVRDNSTYEGVGQHLTKPMVAGQCYEFSIYLSKSRQYYSTTKRTGKKANFVTPAVVRIYGGFNRCSKMEMLAELGPVKNSYWKEFETKIKPSEAYTHIVIHAYYETPVLFAYNGHILADKASDFVPVPCVEPIASEPVAVVETPKSPNPPKQNKSAKNDTGNNNSNAGTTPDKEPEKPKVMDLKRSDMKEGVTFRIQNLIFDADSEMINESSHEALEELYEFLNLHSDLFVEIGGHTNTLADESFAISLSLGRANSVADYLIEKGLDEDRIMTKGYGKSKPIEPNDRYSLKARQMNQRVEIKILEIK